MAFCFAFLFTLINFPPICKALFKPSASLFTIWGLTVVAAGTLHAFGCECACKDLCEQLTGQTNSEHPLSVNLYLFIIRVTRHAGVCHTSHWVRGSQTPWTGHQILDRSPGHQRTHTSFRVSSHVHDFCLCEDPRENTWENMWPHEGKQLQNLRAVSRMILWRLICV